VLQTIYKGAILPLLLYGAPLLIDAMKFEYKKLKYVRVQRLMNLKIAKAFPTTSSEALCVLAGMTPIITRTEQEVKQYTFRKGKEDHTQFIDQEVELKNWRHPAHMVTISK
jgi:hypothetical protein